MKSVDLINSPKNWKEDYEHENGNYMNHCRTCNQKFLGHKRRVQCKECSERQIIGDLLEGEYPDEIYPRAESWLAERRNWIAQVKILEEQINLTQQERRDIAEKAWIECRNNYRKIEDSSVSEFLTNYLDKHYPLK